MQAQLNSERYQDKLTEYLEAIERHGRAFSHPQSGINIAAINALIDISNRMTSMAEQHSDMHLADLGRQLGNQAKSYTHQSGRPVSAEQQARLRTLLELIHFAIADGDSASARTGTMPARPLQHSEELLLIGPATATIADHLRYAGLRARYLETLQEGEAALSQSQPPAAVVQVDFLQSDKPAENGIEMIKSLRERVPLNTPILFVSENQDFASRLAAVQAGGSGFFNLPLDITGIVEKLSKLLRDRYQSAQGKVLLISDQADSGPPVSALLREMHIDVQRIGKANQIIDLLGRFQPDLIILDLEIQNIDSLELVKVLRQHQDCYALPILLLCEAGHREHFLGRLQGYSDDLLDKPIDEKYLAWLVERRLQRNRAVTGKLRDLRNCDSNSGLYNRSYFLTQLELALAANDSPGNRVAVIQIVLDDLASQTEAGADLNSDDVIACAGSHLREHFADEFLVARFSDNRFVILINPAYPGDKLVEFARRLRRSLQTVRLRMNAESIALKLRIGIGVTSPGSRDVAALLRNTEHATELAHSNDEHIQLYSPARDTSDEILSQKTFLQDIIDAVKHEQLRLLFHPILNLEDSERRYEVLLRIANGKGQDLLSESVFGAIQRHRLGLYLDRWVITRCLLELRKQQDYIPTTTLFINLSAITLDDETFPKWLEQQLKKALIPARTLVFEIYEEFARLHPEICKAFGERLLQLGCGFAIERFGSHPDSIAVLQSLKFDYVKLDRKLVKTLLGPQSNVSKRRVSDIAGKLKDLDTAIVATGIEDIHMLPVLWSSGVKYVQGHVLRRPQEKMDFDFVLDGI